MLLEKERKLVIEYSNKLITSGLTKGTGGNISIFNRKENLIAISPTGVEYHLLKPEDIVITKLDGSIVDSKLKPSSELEMHTIYYKNRSDINAVVHCHPIACITLSTLRIPLPAIDYLVAICGAIEVKCAEYASFGSRELAENALKATGTANAVLLANHGLNAVSSDIHMAFSIAETLEMCAEIYLRAKSIGEPIILDKKEMEFMLEKFKTYGKQ